MPTLKSVTPFIDLAAQRDRLAEQIDAAIQRVFAHDCFVSGPEVGELEAALGGRAQGRIAVTCANGTEALELALMGLGVGPGDAVFIPSFTFVATAEAVCRVGATPVFVDVRADTFTLDAVSLEAAISRCRSMDNLNAKTVIPVDMFGQPADYLKINALCYDNQISVIGDAAQSFGAQFRQTPVGALAEISATSFYPSKPLGCYGDGGAVFVASERLAEILKSLRNHGAVGHSVGMNSRLDTLQAAVLLQKLTIFDDELSTRSKIAAAYSAGLKDVVVTPVLNAGASSTWAQYTIRSAQRDAIAEKLQASGIPTAIHYARPVHTLTPYQDYPVSPTGLPNTERLAAEVLSLPMHAYLGSETQNEICDIVRQAVEPR